MAQNDTQKGSAMANALHRLIGIAAPNSTVSQAGNMDAYRQHVIDSQLNGQQPMSFEEFQRNQQRG